MEAATSGYDALHLHVALGYGGREEIVTAVRTALLERAARARTSPPPRTLDATEIGAHLYTAGVPDPDFYTAGVPDPDFVVRTSGEVRSSGFLLWQAAYAEFYFCDAYWPEFRRIDFLRAIRSFQQRRQRLAASGAERVLMYASIHAGDSDNNARARFASAVASVEAEQGLDLTVVDGDFDAYLDGDVALEFAARLAAESWDAVVFVEESYVIPTSVLVEVSTYLAARGGRALATYWATFEDGEFAAFGVPAGAVGGPARAFAAAFGAQVGPSDNVRPVVGGSIDIELDGGLGHGLDATYRLLNADHYVLSYAQRLTPIGPAESLCRYPDELGGSCAVGRAGTTLYLGFTLAPLSESMSGAELETLFRNAMTYVILDAE
jgi:hypothetical protein